MGVTKAPFVNLSVNQFYYLANIPVRFFDSHSYLTGVTTAQLHWHLSNINMILDNVCFDDYENLKKQRTLLSNLHPRTVPSLDANNGFDMNWVTMGLEFIWQVRLDHRGPLLGSMCHNLIIYRKRRYWNIFAKQSSCFQECHYSIAEGMSFYWIDTCSWSRWVPW